MKTMIGRTLCLLVVVGALSLGCRTEVEFYCDDETPCLPRYPDRPFCDLTGEHDDGGIRNTCVGNPTDAGVIDGMNDIDAGTDAEPPECTQPSDCDDGMFCNGSEDCIDNECVAGTAPDCADALDCTVDSCDEVADQCENLPDHSTCTNPDAPFCDGTIGCRDQPCTSSTDCDDDIFCNGTETCNIPGGQTTGSCVAGTAPNCGDGVSCTVDTCSSAMNACANTPMNSLCDNGMYCDGAETCHMTNGCQPGTPPTLSDGVSCTVDACNETTDTVTHTPNNAMCNNGMYCDGAEVCHQTMGCLDQPDPSCSVSCNEGADRCNDCMPDSSVCTAGVTTICNSAGLVQEQVSCALGCFTDGSRCNDLDPSNGLAAYLDLTVGSPSVVLTDGATLDTTSGEFTNGDGNPVTIPSAILAAPANGVAVRVLMVADVQLGDVVVTGEAALAIVSNGDVVLNGRLIVEPQDNSTSGPGAYDTGNCVGAVGSTVNGHTSGSGGGAFGGAAGRGGNSASAAGGAAGTPSGNTALTPLRGGCKGGRNIGSPTDNHAPSGGAVQIVSRTEIRFGPNGEIAASGRGGQWFHVLQASSAGLGGGSGGGILLEAPTVTIVGGSGVHANGGGGGCPGIQGSHGSFQTGAAPGATCGGSYGPGGRGAALLASAANGGDMTGGGGGGGGGGVGRIRINTASGAFVPPGGAVLSPAPSVGSVGRR